MTDYKIVEDHPGCPANRNVAVVGEDGKVLGCHWNPSRAQQQIDIFKKKEGEDPYEGKPYPPTRPTGKGPVTRGGMLDARPANAEELALEGGLDPSDLHVTLHYLGEDSDLYHQTSKEDICCALCEVASNTMPFEARVAGMGYLGPDQDMVAFLEAPELENIRRDLEYKLAGTIPASEHPHYIPHMTLGKNMYLEDTPGMGNWFDRPVHITAIGAKFGDEGDYHTLEGDSGEHVDTPSKDGSQDDKENNPMPDTHQDEGRSVVPFSFRSGNGLDDMKHDKRNLPQPVIDRLAEHDIQFGIVDGVGRAMEHVCFRPEIREDTEAGTATFLGYATRYDFPYDVGGGPEAYGWRETMEVGSCTRSVEERDDVRLLLNHDGIPLARTKAGTLTLKSDEMGLRCEATLDLTSPTAQSVVSAMRRGDLSDMSMGFRVLRDDWNEDYTERSISEIRLFDVSVVGFPANPAAVAMIREDRKPEEEHTDSLLVTINELRVLEGLEPVDSSEAGAAAVKDFLETLRSRATPTQEEEKVEEESPEFKGFSLDYAKALREQLGRER